MDEETNQHTNRYGESTSNEDYTNAGVIQIRLNADPILNRLELYLTGMQSKYVESENGLIKEILVPVSKPKANQQGVYSIMSWLRSVVNSQIVQGNIKTFEDLNFYLADFRMNLAEHIMINLHDWDMSEKDFEGTLDLIMSMVEPFMSRLVGNKERESFTNTIQHTEKSDTQREGKRFGLL